MSLQFSFLRMWASKRTRKKRVAGDVSKDGRFNFNSQLLNMYPYRCGEGLNRLPFLRGLNMPVREI